VVVLSALVALSGLPKIAVADVANKVEMNAQQLQAREALPVVVYREDDDSSVVPLVLFNGRVIGVLSEKTYAQTASCAGGLQINVVDTQTNAALNSQNIVVANVEKTYLKLVSGKNGFTVQQVEANQAKKDLEKVTKMSDIVNRYSPVCERQYLIREISLGADALFAFDSSNTLPGGYSKLDGLIKDLKSQSAQVTKINIVGHSDFLGGEQYNERLSLERAQVVANYLMQNNLSVAVSIDGRGEREPVTTGCKQKNKDKASLISCLQPDRRVVVEVFGSTKS
jgi:OOP family OmpA-OmpF porin